MIFPATSTSMKISGFFHGCWVVKIRPTGSSKGPLLLVSLHLFTLHLGRRPWHWFRCKSAGQNLLVWSVLSVWFRSGSCNHTSIIRWEPWTWRGFFPRGFWGFHLHFHRHSLPGVTPMRRKPHPNWAGANDHVWGEPGIKILMFMADARLSDL